MPQLVETPDLGAFQFDDSWTPERIDAFLTSKRGRATTLGRETEEKRSEARKKLVEDLKRLQDQREKTEESLEREKKQEEIVRRYNPAYRLGAGLYERMFPQAGPPSAGPRYLLGALPKAVVAPVSTLASLVPSRTAQQAGKLLDEAAAIAEESVAPATLETAADEGGVAGLARATTKGFASLPYYIGAGGVARTALSSVARSGLPAGIRRVASVAARPRIATPIGVHPMLAQEIREEARGRGVEAPYIAAAAAVPSAMIESFGTGRLLASTLPGIRRIPGVVRETAGMIGREAVEEAAQEAITAKAPELAGAAPISPEEFYSRLGAAALAGGLLGGTVGGIQAVSVNRRNRLISDAVYDRLGKRLSGSRTFRGLVDSWVSSLPGEQRPQWRNALDKASKGEPATPEEKIAFYGLAKGFTGRAKNLAGIFKAKESVQERNRLDEALDLFNKIERSPNAYQVKEAVEIPGGEETDVVQAVDEGIPGGLQETAVQEAEVPLGREDLQVATGARYSPENATEAVEILNRIRGTKTEVAEPPSWRKWDKSLQNVLEEALGIKVVFVKEFEDRAEAKFDPEIANTVFISKAARGPSPTLSLIGHEATHIIRANDPETYKGLQSEIQKLLDQGYGSRRVTERYKKIWKETGGQDLTDDQAFEELVADFVSDQFVDQRFWDKLRDSNPDTFSRVAVRVYDYLGRIYDRILTFIESRQFGRSKIEGTEVKHRATLSKVLQQDLEAIEKARNAIADSFTKYAEKIGPIRPEESLSAIREQEVRYSPAEISASQDLINRFKRTELMTADDARRILGDQLPPYLENVVAFMSRQRAKLAAGEMTPRDIAKAYVVTLGSIGAQAIQVDVLEEKTGFVPPENFISISKSGKRVVRPEEAVAAWLGTDIGQAALNDIEAGVVNIPAWQKLDDLRRAYGRSTLKDIVTEGGKQKNLRDIREITNDINRAGTDPKKLFAAITSLRGIGNAKNAFVQSLLGVGASPTVDAVEINFWLTGRANIKHLKTAQAKLARKIKESLSNKRVSKEVVDRISSKVNRLAKEYSGVHDIPPEVASHVIHHWLWDRAKGTETSHAGMMEAVEKYSPREFYPTFEAAKKSLARLEPENAQQEKEKIATQIGLISEELEKEWKRLNTAVDNLPKAPTTAERFDAETDRKAATLTRQVGQFLKQIDLISGLVERKYLEDMVGGAVEPWKLRMISLGVVQQSARIESLLDRLRTRMNEVVEPELAAAVADLQEERPILEMRRDFAASMSDELVHAYKEYLKNEHKVSGDATLPSRINAIYQDFAVKMRGEREAINQIRTIFNRIAMADPRVTNQVLSDPEISKDSASFYDWLKKTGIIQDALKYLNDTNDGATDYAWLILAPGPRGGRPLLAQWPSLVSRIKTLRQINRQSDKAQAEIREFISGFFGEGVKISSDGTVISGPQGKKASVTPAQFARRFRDFQNSRSEAAEKIRQINQRFRRASYQMEGITKAVAYLESLTEDERFRLQANQAIENLGFHFGDELKVTKDTIEIRLPDRDPSEPVVIKLTANGELIPGEEMKLRDAEVSLASWVTDAEANKYMGTREEQAMLNTRRRILREVQDRLNPAWKSLGNTNSIPMVNILALISGKGFNLPLVRALYEMPQELANSLPGQLRRDFKKALDDMDYLTMRWRELYENRRFALMKAIDDAIRSHGLVGIKSRDHHRIWKRAVIEPIVNSGQNTKSAIRLKAGDYLYSTELDGFVDRVTEEDLRAVRLMHEYETTVHQEVSNTLKEDARGLQNPLEIQEDEKLFRLGGTVWRLPVQTGPWTMSRKLQRFASDILERWWDKNKIKMKTPKDRGPSVIDPDDAREIHEQWLTDNDADGTPRYPDFFNYFVLGYINEGNPELGVRYSSSHRAIYDKLHREQVNGRKFRNVQEVVVAIAEEMDSDVDKEERRSSEDREKEASRILFSEIEKFSHDLLSAHHPFIESYQDETVNVNVLNPKDSFNKARGRLLGPSIFYDHSITNNEDMLALQNSALRHVTERAIEAAQRAITALSEERDRLLEAIRASGERVAGTFDEERRRLRAIERVIDRARWHQSQAEALLRNDDEALGRRRAWAFLRGIMASTVLSPWLNVISPAVDYFSTNVFWTPLSQMHTSALRGLFFQPTAFLAKESAKGMGRIFKNAFADILRVSRNKKGIKDILDNWKWMSDAIVRFEATRNEAISKGFMKRPAIQDQMEILRRTERVEGFVTDPMTPDNQTRSQKAVERYIAWFEEKIGVRLREWRNEMELVNVVGQLQATSSGLKSMKDLAYRVYREREQIGVPKEVPLSAAEMDMVVESFERWTELFGSVAPMEEVFSEFYQRTKDMTPKERSKARLGRTEVEQDLITRGVMMAGALIDVPSLRPFAAQRRDIVGSAARTILFLSNWANRARYQVGHAPLMSEVSRERPETIRQLIGLSWLMLGTGILAGLGGAAYEFREAFRRLLTGQPSAQIRLRQVLARGDAYDTMKWLTASYASNMPIIGRPIADFLGTRTYSFGSMFDVSDNVFMFGAMRNFAVTAQKAYQTGTIGVPARDYLRRQVPNTQFFINRWDEGDADARSAARLLRAIAPRGLEIVSSRGGYYRQTPMTMGARMLMAAGMTGDPQQIRDAYESLVQAHINSGKTREEAEKSATRQISAMSPERRSFGRYLTDAERAKIYEATSPEERALIERAANVREVIKAAVKPGNRRIPAGIRVVGGRSRRGSSRTGTTSFGLPDLRRTLRLPTLTLK